MSTRRIGHDKGVLDGARNANGTYNGAKVMSNMTGLSVSTITELAAKAKANVDRLHKCASHAFEPIPPLDAIRQRYRCAHCAGEVDASAYRWYEQGRAHEAAKAARK